ncbi:hypothetical protein C1O66_03395 [Paucibacter aquatile]|uniref:Uncharacterized protein n=1 Tax=Kinneretia aquatilis TaxID=2070761 RepID=A0A2N8KRC2_9BURK|nr:hypothetical protein C1O66_19660 [Paucibacter aquatile]PND40421.1 hypothetical protein C1O66_03395 [Paucibacter aquatile]
MADIELLATFCNLAAQALDHHMEWVQPQFFGPTDGLPELMHGVSFERNAVGLNHAETALYRVLAAAEPFVQGIGITSGDFEWIFSGSQE